MSAPGASPLDDAVRANMERNLQLLPVWWVLRWAWLGEAIWVIYLIDVRGLTLGQVLLFEAAYSTVVVLVEVPTGILADRFGRRPMLIAGSLGWGAAFTTFGLATTFETLLGSYILFAIGYSLFSGADTAFLFDTLRTLGRGDEFARRAGRLNGVSTVVTALFTLAGSLMVRWTPLAWPMVLSGVFSLVAAASALPLREPPAVERATSFFQAGASATRRAVRTPQLRWAIAIAAVAQVGATIVFITFQPIVIDAGAPVWSLGGFATAILLVSGLGGWSSGTLLGRYGLNRTLRVLVAFTGLALFSGAFEVLWLFPLFILPAFVFEAVHPLVADYLARRVPDGERATMLSINELAAQIGGIVVTVALGIAVDRLGTGISLAALGVAMLLFGLGAYALWRREGDLELALPATVEAQ
ncbi:MAG: MFS transporter [Dehalococcoidia bacterium]